MGINIDLNALVDTYDIDNVYEDYKRAEFLSKISNYVDFKSSSVLEFGPATGRLTVMLSKIAQDVLAVEGSSRFLDIAKKAIGNADNVSFLHSLFEDIDMARKFDCLILHHVLEHVSDSKAVLFKAKALLKEDGVLAISVPNAHSLSRQLAVKMGLLNSLYDLTENDLHHGHVRVYDWDTIEKEVQSFGFEISGRHGLSFKLFSDRQNIMMLNSGIIGEDQIKGLWSLGDEYYQYSGAIMLVARKQ